MGETNQYPGACLLAFANTNQRQKKQRPGVLDFKLALFGRHESPGDVVEFVRGVPSIRGIRRGVVG